MTWVSKFSAILIERIQRDAWIYLAIAGYTIVGLSLAVITQHVQLEIYSNYLSQFAQAFLIILPLVAITIDLAFVRLRFASRQSLAGSRMFSSARIAHLIAGMMLMMGVAVFLGTFTSIKNLMPILRGGFLYDSVQADMDRWLWFGTQPWKVLYAMAGNVWVLQGVEWNYGLLWFIVCFGAFFFVATSPKADAVRARYILLFILVWIVCGNLLAVLFISAGPIFYAGVTGITARFAQQHAFLAMSQSSHSALAYERYLWDLHQNGLSGFGSGISAFPSVHVGMATMNAFFAAELSWKVGTIAFTYLLLVALSSVFLGWHYSIDGIAAFLVVAVMYYGIRRIAPH